MKELNDIYLGKSVNPLESVVFASTENIDIENPGSIDSHYFRDGGCRVLLKDQLDPKQNGIYAWAEHEGPLTFIQSMSEGDQVFVESGLENRSTSWVKQRHGGFLQTSGQGVDAPQYLNGNGQWEGVDDNSIIVTNGFSFCNTSGITGNFIVPSHTHELKDVTGLEDIKNKLSLLESLVNTMQMRLQTLETRNHKLENVYKNYV